MGLVLPDAGRGMGTRIVGSKGSGKTILLGRGIAFSDFRRGIGGCLIDPDGRTVDEFLGRFDRLPPEEQARLGPRLRYVGMAGLTGYVCPLPVYFRDAGDSLFQAAQRPLEVWRRVDPALGSAPIQGLNAILNTGIHAGMALSAMSCRLTEGPSLLTEPQRWAGRLRQVEHEEPAVGPAVKWLLSDMPKPGTNRWDSHVASYLNKVNQIVLDDVSRAIYGADEPGFAWADVAEQGLFVLVDFRGVTYEEQKSFGLVWVLRGIVEFLKRRGPGKRHPIFALYLEELTYFLSADYRQQDVLAGDLEELTARIARNANCWLLVSHQEINQLSRKMANVLMACGNQIFASTSDLEGGAEVWAKRFERFDPKKAKDHRPQWMHGDRRAGEGDYIVDWLPVYESMQEQVREVAQEKYMDLPPLTFWASVSPREGKLGGAPMRFSIKGRVGERWVDEERVAEARRQLAERDGRKVSDVLAEIAARRRVDAGASATAPRRPSRPPGAPSATAPAEPGRLEESLDQAPLLPPRSPGFPPRFVAVDD